MRSNRTEDQWQRYAMAAAIAAARKIAAAGTVIPAGTSIARLSETEWGWIIAAVLFAWIRARSEQATAEGINVERAIREGAADGWDAGAVGAILPELAMVDIDWTKPLAAWPRETMVEFLTKAFGLIRTAMAARDLGGGVTRNYGAERIAREANAAAGNPLVAPSDLNDEVDHLFLGS
jgi:hypothetical protein